MRSVVRLIGVATLLGMAVSVMSVVGPDRSLPAASAMPATAVTYGPGSSATHFAGSAFDACAAPSASTMTAWLASPYRGVGVYISGVNRACRQPNLTSSWVSTVTRQGWRIIPIVVGPQAPCANQAGLVSISRTNAEAEGVATAAEAVAAAGALGMVAGSALYVDIENYRSTDTACRSAVLSYLSGWTTELHRRGYLSGVYAGQASGAAHLTAAFDSRDYARPDVLWLARWDRSTSLRGWSAIPDSMWASRQRIKQHTGDHLETHGGQSIVIDSNSVDAPVATVALGYRVTTSTSLNARSGPSTSSPVIRRLGAGSTASVVCQVAGTGPAVGGTGIWDRLSDGSFVSDRYLSTPSKTTFSAPLPRCTYPAQVVASSLTRRGAPTPASPKVGGLPNGALAWVRCQTIGAQVESSSVWNLLDTTGDDTTSRPVGGYVADHYIITSTRSSFTPGVPRC